ncbi:plasma membrane stretch-activated calcium ion channel Yam8 [Schizosaccharomyces pombe]|uniref:Stretch-activated cation channel yam8 n=1 Tax=Schizosaccharomyces pombe (strain 972 / ATCC 24843) TaxID=284812 RepID=MID1_SCHPO|nr:calcium channel regulatory subunit Yam8 [Schizosaccharomyces pombe]Q10063.1 RecName: Full=Calcium influx-promoting protein ehs1; Flags: Precursor [Schizosaccharomyces pombe 972h-]CAA92236.1 calcium channel regulatory subunit Yam8 [Schizosaccharomyces pombe]|eukprot:NP_592865.1 calcium channel regulatory subunit Yam8 [Schizosaccharomyces pombe]
MFFFSTHLILKILFFWSITRNIFGATYTSLLLNNTINGNINDQSTAYYNLTWEGNTAYNVSLTLSTCTAFDGANDLMLYISNNTFDEALPLDNFTITASENGLATIFVTGYSPLYIAVSSAFSQFAPNFFVESGESTLEGNNVINYELAAGIDTPFSQYNATKFLFAQDTDFQAALLITGNLTTNETSIIPSYEIYVNPSNSTYDNTFNKFSSSFCAFQNNPSTVNTNNADRSMTLRGLGPFAKEQFYLKGLDPNVTYTAYLVEPNIGQPGGTVYPGVTFTTKTSPACQLIYDLQFCSEVAYAVPGNSSLFSASALAEWYDQQAYGYYQNFTYTLDLIPCNATSWSAYSLLKNCSDCANSYKNWLCASVIPRCADINDNSSYLIYKNYDSRYPLIDEVIQPGPYKEVLPCSYLCYSLASSCPLDLGFACPKAGYGLEFSYGEVSNVTGLITCNAPGVEFYESGSALLNISWRTFFISLIFWILFVE